MIQIAQPTLGTAEWEALREPLETGWLTQGPLVADFERRFAEVVDVPHALAVTSCTTGLHLILAALGVGPGDEVVVPAFTWVATANAVRYCGAEPVFVDVDETTYNLDLDLVGAALTDATKVIVPVHLFGLCADVDELRRVVGDHRIAIIEDAACAVGAGVRGVPAGGLGDAAAFSFHPRKIITTGEGGMVTTRDPDLAARMDRLRNHGASIPEEVRHAGPQPYLLPDFDDLGFNYRMTDLQGAVGIAQLGRLDALLADRRRRASWYQEQLAHIPWLRLPRAPDGFAHSWQSFVTVVDDAAAPLPRNEIMARLLDHGISTRPGTHAVTSLGYYRNRGADPAAYPVAAMLAASTMAIPLHGAMTDDDFDRVVDALCSFGD